MAGFFDDAFGSSNPDAEAARRGVKPLVDQFGGWGPGQGGPLGIDQYKAAPGAVDQVHQAQGFDPSLFSSLRGDLTNQAHGLGPSVAQQQLQQGTDRNMAGSLALLASQRGMNPGAAARMAGNNLAGINQQAAGQAVAGRLQEQQQAQGLLANLNTSQAGLEQNNNQFNADTYNKQLGNDANNQAAFERARAQQIADMEAQRRRSNLDLRNGFVSGVGQAASGGASGGLGALGQALPFLLA